MHIIVCIKQVPDSQKVKVDPETGVLRRSGVDSKMNPYDLYAIETALRIRENTGGKISVISMGPMSALDVISEAMAMGADEGFLLSDRRFGGADVKATSYTLSQGIKFIDPEFDLIICGRQTTDGDTAQVGPSLAEHLNIPHVSWCCAIMESSEHDITVKQTLSDSVLTVAMDYPCLLTVEKNICQPRLPSYRLMKASKDKTTKVITLDDLGDKDPAHYGLNGSATQVEGIFEPVNEKVREVFDSSNAANALKLYEKLKDEKYL